jgi:hypothetical protein
MMGDLIKHHKQKQILRSPVSIAHILMSWNTKLHRKSLYIFWQVNKNTINNMVVKL